MNFVAEDYNLHGEDRGADPFRVTGGFLIVADVILSLVPAHLGQLIRIEDLVQ